jgi:hypothetical protein
MSAYEAYAAGTLEDVAVPDEVIEASLAQLPQVAEPVAPAGERS